jgi:hypothetical protein
MTLDQANAKIKEVFHDLASMEEASLLALSLTEQSGHDFIAIDRGDYHWPQYGVVAAPRIGDLVSISFNGDRHPCGQIKSISKTLKVITTTNGRTFYRRGKSAAWINDGTWTMIPGHVSSQNESF